MIRYISSRDVENLIERLRSDGREADAAKLEHVLTTPSDQKGDRLAATITKLLGGR